METSQLQYIFPNPPHLEGLAVHERLPLQLLGLTARGVIRPTGEIRLLPRPVSSQLTLQDVAGDRNTYSAPACIEDNRLILHCSKLLWSLQFNSIYLYLSLAFLIAPRFSSVQFTENGKQHHCLSKRFFRRFAGDGSSSVGLEDDGVTSGGEDLDSGTENDLEMAEVAASIAPATHRLQTSRYNLVSCSYLLHLKYLKLIAFWIFPISEDNSITANLYH